MDDPEALSIVLPREGLGNSYALNWALNYYSVTPSGAAYGNLDARQLTARARGALTEPHRALSVVDEAESVDVPVLVVGRDISLADYRAISLEARREHLTSAPELFVHDW